MTVGMIGDNSLGDGLEYGRLPGLGWGYDHGSLPLAQGAEQVDYPIRLIGTTPDRAATFQLEGLIRMLGTHLRKDGPPWEFLRSDPIHQVEMSQGGALPVLGFLPNVPLEFVSRSQIEFLNDPSSDVNVVFARGV
jgi:hypothetical protein